MNSDVNFLPKSSTIQDLFNAKYKNRSQKIQIFKEYETKYGWNPKTINNEEIKEQYINQCFTKNEQKHSAAFFLAYGKTNFRNQQF